MSQASVATSDCQVPHPASDVLPQVWSFLSQYPEAHFLHSLVCAASIYMQLSTSYLRQPFAAISK